MTDEKLARYLRWVPLAIAAGYFVFLIATWSQFIRGQQEMRSKFDEELDKWMKEKRATGSDRD